MYLLKTETMICRLGGRLALYGCNIF